MVDRLHRYLSAPKLPLIQEGRIHLGYVESYDIFQVDYYFRDSQRQGRVLYKDRLFKSRGKRYFDTPETITDPHVREFSDRILQSPHLGNLAIVNNLVTVFLDDPDVYFAWPGFANEVREPLGALISAKFPEHPTVTFTELPPAVSGKFAQESEAARLANPKG